MIAAEPPLSGQRIPGEYIHVVFVEPTTSQTAIGTEQKLQKYAILLTDVFVCDIGDMKYLVGQVPSISDFNEDFANTQFMLPFKLVYTMNAAKSGKIAAKLFNKGDPTLPWTQIKD